MPSACLGSGKDQLLSHWFELTEWDGDGVGAFFYLLYLIGVVVLYEVFEWICVTVLYELFERIGVAVLYKVLEWIGVVMLCEALM